ncbi:MAG: UDP-N-acetylglucosamine 1-carboxyvinyltransferase [bacterium]|nr:UDP-N-acetylglucosamine 1-carboxyvinyltransferase [bacterium]
MDKFIINGGKQLEGEVKISGAKNAVLPVITAAILANGVSTIKNVPNLQDVNSMCKLLEVLGAKTNFENSVLTIDSTGIKNYHAPYDLVRKMRASVYVLGPLLGRFGLAEVSLPGGCAWGPRPIDLHLSGMESLGAKIDLDGGYIKATAKKLKGNYVKFKKSSVGATGNVLMAAVLAEGETVMENTAVEPEITFLAESLQSMGAKITGIGERILKITGVSKLDPMNISVIPDRIEAGTFLTACAIAGGKITLKNAEKGHINAVLEALKKTGVQIETGTDITIESDGVYKPVDVMTDVYPGFPTDMQAQWIALMSVADGNSIIEDTIYHDRFTHVAELNRLGANISVENNRAYVKSTGKLIGAPVMSTDLRASASLIMAGLRAEGKTAVQRIYHIDRGYESIEKKLQNLGADIERVRS